MYASNCNNKNHCHGFLNLLSIIRKHCSDPVWDPFNREFKGGCKQGCIKGCIQECKQSMYSLQTSDMLDIANNTLLKPAVLLPGYLSCWHKEIVTGTLRLLFSWDLKHALKDLNMFHCLEKKQQKQQKKFTLLVTFGGGGRPRWKVVTLSSVLVNPSLIMYVL